MKARTVTAVLDAPREQVFRYLSDVENLPTWATEFARELRFEDGKAKVVEADGLGEFYFSIDADPDTGPDRHVRRPARGGARPLSDPRRRAPRRQGRLQLHDVPGPRNAGGALRVAVRGAAPGVRQHPRPVRVIDDVGFLLAKATHRWNELLAERFAATGHSHIRPSYGSVLVPLFEEDGLRMGELARRARLSKQTMTELVRRLEEDGLVERRPDPSDGRASLIFLTARSRDFEPAATLDPRRSRPSRPRTDRRRANGRAPSVVDRASRPRPQRLVLQGREKPGARPGSMRWRGLEPPRAAKPTRPSTLRVYQFRHQRARSV